MLILGSTYIMSRKKSKNPVFLRHFSSLVKTQIILDSDSVADKTLSPGEKCLFFSVQSHIVVITNTAVRLNYKISRVEREHHFSNAWGGIHCVLFDNYSRRYHSHPAHVPDAAGFSRGKPEDALLSLDHGN